MFIRELHSYVVTMVSEVVFDPGLCKIKYFSLSF